MRANEFVAEGTKGKLRKSAGKAMHKTHAFNDGHDAGNNYNFNRVGIAVAMADGSNKKLDIDDRTWYHNNNVAVPYTELEHKMLNQAFKNVSTESEQIVRDHRSLEPDTVNKQSPVATKKKNKYGV